MVYFILEGGVPFRKGRFQPLFKGARGRGENEKWDWA